MKHFDITDWADFVRAVTVGIDRAAMEQHLSSGCSRCRSTVAALRTAAAVVGVDTAFEPPARDILRAEKLLAVHRPQKLRNIHRLVPRLVYDSLLHEPALASVRGSPRARRQVLYEAGNFYLDMSFEPLPDARLVRLWGQVADRRNPASFPGTGPVLLKSGRRTVRRAAPSEFHEFQIDFLPQSGLRLNVPIPGAVLKRIEISLDDFLGAEPRGAEPVSSKSLPKRSRVRPRAGRKARHR